MKILKIALLGSRRSLTSPALAFDSDAIQLASVTEEYGYSAGGLTQNPNGTTSTSFPPLLPAIISSALLPPAGVSRYTTGQRDYSSE